MLRKVSVPVSYILPSTSSSVLTGHQISGLLLNNAHYLCPACSSSSSFPPKPQYLFGPPDRFRATAARLDIPILAELPLVPGISAAGDAGVPYGLVEKAKKEEDGKGGVEWIEGMRETAGRVWAALGGVEK